MNKLLLSSLLTGLAFFSKGQDIENHRLSDGRINDYTIVEEALDKRFPGYIDQVNQWYQQSTQAVNSQATRSSNQKLTINVVVHIVWKQSAENLSDFFVNEQIRILNESFQRQNADTTNMRSIFQPIAGNPNIEFVLAGIERVQTNTDFNPDFIGGTLYDDIKSYSTGGSSPWDPSSFMNIWVGKLQGDFLAGYAYPPAGVPGWEGNPATPGSVDGIVVDYRAFGPFGNFLGNPISGMTSVHEVGHYLGLRHIWGDGDCSADDNVADTPIAGSESQFDCNKNKNTCNQGAGDLPDMVENYMDYSQESCQNSFTKGQADLMRMVVQVYRSGLLTPSVAGVKELENNEVSVFPNPATNFVNVSLSNRSSLKQINILDISGKMLLNTTELNVDLSSLKKGTYIMNVYTDKGMSSKKLILN